jgi:hypothetical protein
MEEIMDNDPVCAAAERPCETLVLMLCHRVTGVPHLEKEKTKGIGFFHELLLFRGRPSHYLRSKPSRRKGTVLGERKEGQTRMAG